MTAIVTGNTIENLRRDLRAAAEEGVGLRHTPAEVQELANAIEEQEARRDEEKRL